MAQVIYSPGTPLQTAETPVVTTAPVVEAPKTEEPKPSLADEIRADRERRAAQVKKETEEAGASKELGEVKAKLSKVEKAKENILLDSLSYLKELGLDEREAAAVAENIMFTLVPEKAPVDFRQKALEAQYARDKKLQAEKEARRGDEDKTAKEAAAKAEGEKLEQEFVDALASAVGTFTEQSHPASVTWFGSDHQDYMESMLHTARNLAAEATKAGKQADLSVANIAATLEKKLAEKASRFKGQSPAQEKIAVKPSPAPEKQTGSEDKKPEPNKKREILSDEERIRRAAAVVFRDAG